jgi:hypothetical protein
MAETHGITENGIHLLNTVIASQINLSNDD